MGVLRNLFVPRSHHFEDEWSVRQIFNPVILGLSPILATKFFLGCPECKTLAKLLNSQLVSSCHLEFFILLCS